MNSSPCHQPRPIALLPDQHERLLWNPITPLTILESSISKTKGREMRPQVLYGPTVILPTRNLCLYNSPILVSPKRRFLQMVSGFYSSRTSTVNHRQRLYIRNSRWYVRMARDYKPCTAPQ